MHQYSERYISPSGASTESENNESGKNKPENIISEIQ
jgi:hypothetical protein